MIQFECKSCKHMPKGKCYWCGKTKREYKKSHPHVHQWMVDLYGIFRGMVKFRMETTRCVAVDKNIYAIWGNPINYNFADLQTVEQYGR